VEARSESLAPARGMALVETAASRLSMRRVQRCGLATMAEVKGGRRSLGRADECC
jgi:hypothetical protein